MKELAKLDGLPREDWLRLRHKGIGSSDAAVIMGASRWSSPLALYLQKREEIQEADLATEREEVEAGVILEPAVAEFYRRRTGRRVEMPQAILQHDVVPWLLASPDRFVFSEGAALPAPAAGMGVVELKTASIFRADDWEGEPPLAYQIQGQHQMAVTGLAWASFAVLIGGNRFRWCDVVRNDRFIKAMVSKEKEFWDRVLHGDPPPAGSSEADTRALALLYPAESGEEAAIALEPEALKWHLQRDEACATIKEAELLKREAENNLKQMIGDATYGVLPGGNGRYSWKTVNKKEYIVPAGSSRVFRHVR